MRNDNQAGSISVVVAILSTLLLIAVSVFAFWVYGQMQDYKLHSDQKAAAAVSAAKTAQAAELKKQYDQEAKNPYKIQQLSSVAKSGKVRATAYIPPKMVGRPNVSPGIRFDGAISHNTNGDQIGSIIIIQVRDKTLKISTQSVKFLDDFNKIILENLTFVP
jgi:hypothetical protein